MTKPVLLQQQAEATAALFLKFAYNDVSRAIRETRQSLNVWLAYRSESNRPEYEARRLGRILNYRAALRELEVLEVL